MIQLNVTLKSMILVGALVCLSGGMASAQGSKDERMAWFREAKFGMFIHWGGSSVHLDTEGKSRTEIIELQAKHFNPVKFDAVEWVRIAKDAGLKYITYTTKHHNGFCHWDSALTDWDVMDQTPFKRDVVAELAKASKAAGFAWASIIRLRTGIIRNMTPNTATAQVSISTPTPTPTSTSISTICTRRSRSC